MGFTALFQFSPHITSWTVNEEGLSQGSAMGGVLSAQIIASSTQQTHDGVAAAPANVETL